ncbi:MAG: hypothetical protein NC123_20785 [Butyrivibrio sp.]|nr:hypothetical protein [Butyrivibrio sp.]
MRAKAVTADEQYRLIMECRASGMTDYHWCAAHNIKPGTFYNWVERLRQSRDIDIQAPSGNKEPARQDTVEIHLRQPSIVLPCRYQECHLMHPPAHLWFSASLQCWNCPWQVRHSGSRRKLTLASWSRCFLY